MRITLADSPNIGFSTAVSFHSKLCGNSKSSPSGVSEPIDCHVLYHVLPNLTSDVVLGMDRLHAIICLINWNA